MPVKTGLKLTTISYVILYVKDAQKALPFYRDVLGATVKTEEQGWIELDTGATTLALHSDTENKAKQGSSAVVVFNVENTQEAYEVLKSNGVKIIHAPHTVCETPDHIGVSVDFEDPEGNMLSAFGFQKR